MGNFIYFTAATKADKLNVPQDEKEKYSLL